MMSELSFCLWAEHSCFIRLGLPFGLRSMFFFFSWRLCPEKVLRWIGSRLTDEAHHKAKD